MNARKGDWRDLFAAHSLAVDANKLLLGFIAVLVTFILIGLTGTLYGITMDYKPLAAFGNFSTQDNILFWLLTGHGSLALGRAVRLLNPLSGDITHVAMSVLFYLVLLWVWAYYGGAISRLTALQYGKDEIPTLHEATQMARRKRKAYYFALLTPVFGVVLFAVCNAVIGLIGAIPYVGPWLMIPLVPFCSIPTTVIMIFVGVLGALSFSLMIPAISISGKDAFEGWSSAYSYVIWGFNRWLCYSLLVLVIGAVSTLVAWFLGELFIYGMAKTLSAGFGKHVIYYAVVPCGSKEGCLHWFFYTMGPYVGPVISGKPGFELVGMTIASSVVASIALFVRVLVFAYAASYFFTSNTIVCMLLRKHVDRVETNEVYEEEPEEAPAAGAATASAEPEKKEQPPQ